MENDSRMEIFDRKEVEKESQFKKNAKNITIALIWVSFIVLFVFNFFVFNSEKQPSYSSSEQFPSSAWRQDLDIIAGEERLKNSFFSFNNHYADVDTFYVERSSSGDHYNRKPDIKRCEKDAKSLNDERGNYFDIKIIEYQDGCWISYSKNEISEYQYNTLFFFFIALSLTGLILKGKRYTWFVIFSIISFIAYIVIGLSTGALEFNIGM